MLGVIIGVMSVIVLIAIGQGTTVSSSRNPISSMGTNPPHRVHQTRRVGMGMPGGFGGGSSSKGTVILKLDDILALEDDDSIQYVSPTTSGSLTEVKVGSTNTSATVMGVLGLREDRQSGRAERPVSSMRTWTTEAPCVIGPGSGGKISLQIRECGRNTLHIDGCKFKIVGVLESKGTSMGAVPDDSLILPFTLAQRMLGRRRSPRFYISAVVSASVDAAQEIVETSHHKNIRK